MTEKSFPQPSSPQIKSRTLTRYSLIWGAAALISLLYLILLVTQPTLVADLLGSGSHNTELEATRKAVNENVAEVRSLRETIDVFRSELVEMRAQISGQTDATRDLASRMATIEADIAEQQKVAALDPQVVKAKEAAAKKAAKEAAAKEAAAKKAAQAEATKKADGALETGSVAQPATGGAISFGPPTVTTTTMAPPPAGNLIGVQIATGPSVDSLRLSWTLLNERHGDSFRALEPRYTTDMSGSEQTYDLIVGPVASVDDAKRLCQELALKATPCAVSRFTGDSL